MRKIYTAIVAVTCLAMLGQFSTVSAQSAEKKNGSSAKTAMVKENVSRAFVNGYNVPSSGVAIEGYCPVCYIEASKAVKGKPELTHDYNGVTYWFVNDGARKAFVANPEKYLPAYGGWCAVGAAMGQRIPVDPTNFKVVDGKIMLFLKNSKVDTLEMWNKNEKELKAKADANWKKLKG